MDFNVTQCTICPGVKGICHKKCTRGNGQEKIKCCVMDRKTKICVKCQHIWSDHVNSAFVYKEEEVEVTVDIQHLKVQYENGV